MHPDTPKSDVLAADQNSQGVGVITLPLSVVDCPVGCCVDVAWIKPNPSYSIPPTGFFYIRPDPFRSTGTAELSCGKPEVIRG
jgi:hypothetical protein